MTRKEACCKVGFVTHRLNSEDVVVVLVVPVLLLGGHWVFSEWVQVHVDLTHLLGVFLSVDGHKSSTRHKFGQV